MWKWDHPWGHFAVPIRHFQQPPDYPRWQAENRVKQCGRKLMGHKQPGLFVSAAGPRSPAKVVIWWTLGHCELGDVLNQGSRQCHRLHRSVTGQLMGGCMGTRVGMQQNTRQCNTSWLSSIIQLTQVEWCAATVWVTWLCPGLGIWWWVHGFMNDFVETEIKFNSLNRSENQT